MYPSAPSTSPVPGAHRDDQAHRPDADGDAAGRARCRRARTDASMTDRRRRHAACGAASTAVTVLMVSVLSGCDGSGASALALSTRGSDEITISGHSARAPRIAMNATGAAIAAWESTVGGPIEVALRTPAGRWTAPVAVTESAATSPQVGIDQRGDAVVVWDGHDARGLRTARLDEWHNGRWLPIRTLGQPSGTAPSLPRLAVAPSGAAIAVWQPGGGGLSAITRLPGGTWSAPSDVLPGSHHVLAIAVGIGDGGTPVAVWLEARAGGDSVVMASQAHGDRWGTPVALSAPHGQANDPELSIASDGRAVAAWVVDAGPGQQVESAVATAAGRWSRAEPVSHITERPLGLPRPPSPFVVGPSVAATPGGGTVAVWTTRANGNDVAMVAIRGAGGRWRPSRPLSPGSTASGWPQAVAGPGRVVDVVWEELDGSDISIRSAAISSGGAPNCRAELSPPHHEIAAPRVAASAAGALAIWNDTNWYTIAVGSVPACR